MKQEFKKGDAVIYRYKGFNYVGQFLRIYKKKSTWTNRISRFYVVQFYNRTRLISISCNLKHLTSIIK